MTMAAPVLTVADQNKTLSGKKNKKRTVKNVLGLPSNLKTASPVIGTKEAEKLNKILGRLLPLARLPVQQNPRFKKPKDQEEPTPEKSELKECAKNKRSQLSLGVNEVNKSIKKELISAVLLASDIQPKFFIHHLNLLCTQNKIPFLHVPDLREVTKNSLGFPCIALGFKKNLSDFSEAIDEIKIIAAQYNISKGEDQESSMESSDEDDEEVTDSEEFGDSEIKSDIAFTYLRRTSTKTRVFVPECQKSEPQKSDIDFISVLREDDSKIKSNLNIQLRITKSSLKKSQNKKMLNIKDLHTSETDDEEDLEVKNKKVKIGWEIDKRGTGKKFKYQPANLLKVFSNPNRIKKKNK